MGSDLDANSDRPRTRGSAAQLLAPIFGAPLSMKRKTARALVRAQVTADPVDRFHPLAHDPELDDETHTNGKTIETKAMGVPALIRYRLGTEIELMASVPKRIPQMVADYWGFALQPVHKRMLELLFAGGYLDFMIPTEHGKSTICDVVFTLLSLANNPDAAHIICCTNHDDAKRWLKVIKMKIESRHVDPYSAALIRDYPWLKKPTGSLKPWGASEITIDGRTDPNNSNPSVAAMGRGADDLRGRRAKFVGDDLEGKGAVRETARTELWEWMTLEAMRMIEDVTVDPRRVWANVGTPYDPDSVHFRLAELNRTDGTPIFNVYRQPYKYDSGKLIWPAKKEKIAELRDLWQDERQWAIAMELNPKGDNPFTLTKKEIDAHSAASTVLETSVAGFITLDPASGSKNARTDYAGIAVARLNWPGTEILPKIDVIEAYKYTDESWPQVIFAAELARKYGYPVIVEMNAMQKSYKGLFAHLAPDVKVIPFYTSEHNKFDKKMGLTVLKTLVRTDRLHVCPGEGGETLKKEIRDLGTGAHDHIALAVWFSVFYVYMYHRKQSRRATIISTSPIRGYHPIVGRRTMRIITPFSPRRLEQDGSDHANERRVLPDSNPG